MKLGNKIRFGFGMAFLLTGAVLVWAILNLRTLGTSSSSVLSENFRSITAAERMATALDGQEGAILRSMLSDKEAAMTRFSENEAEFFRWFAVEENNITVPGEAGVVERIRETYRVFLSTAAAFMNGRGAEGLDAYGTSVVPLLESVHTELASLRDLNQKTMYAASNRTEVIAARAIVSMAVIGGIIALAGLSASFILAEILVRPVRSVTVALERIGKGDYGAMVESDSNDELGALSESFNAMALKLKRYNDLNVERLLGEKGKNDAVLRTIDDGILVVDGEMRITNANPAAETALAFRVDQERPKHFLECVDNRELFEFIKSASATGKPPVIPEEKRILSMQDGESYRHYQFSINPVVIRQNEPAGVVLLLRDVTELKEIDRLKTEFLMTASHELRTPLTSIGISMDVLREELGISVGEKNREILEAAGTEVRRLRALIDDLLDLSKLESGKIEMEIERTDASILLGKAVEVMRPQSEEKKLKIRMAGLPDGIPVNADGNKIVWVLTNLISNAIRYTDPDGSITLGAEKRGRFVHFSVADTGTGIPFRDQSRIFDKFVQLRDGRNAGGSGLGLAICREIVRAHGGTIWVESTPGRGSVFTFTIPAVPDGREA